ncbi:MAG: hypothetical protein DI556_19305 [Rhodovulum sulfidophilum]|uniref:MotA/TolQ/ExbB proton channel domain-containing protein n=1 Tax=Rhodovulum sulfidophilum TaxID=35806 RepID=A0A2W5Q5V0_RHOSU|nr:MAG: hypothetical protein DI556_19305 [Rhodovulum sulfidophilum]
MFFRYLLFNAVSLFIVAFLFQYYDALNWLLANDPTRISLLISAIYIILVAYLLPSVLGKSADVGKVLQRVSFIGKSLMGIGLIGTVIGMMHIFATIGVVTDIKTAIPQLMLGVGTAQITTLFGLSSALLVSYLTFFVFGVTEDER